MNQSLRILLVEDEILTAIAMEIELKQAGYDVCRRVATGEDAVMVARQESPDLILMDIRLAGELDGIEAAQQIQASSSIPIIFMTGYPDEEIEERARKLNPLGYFLKPVRLPGLQPLIDVVKPHETQ